MDGKTYNGWANYETWNIILWINNDEPLYRLSCDYAGRGSSDARDFCETWLSPTATPDLESDVIKDGLVNVYNRVDWDEVHSALLENARDH